MSINLKSNLTTEETDAVAYAFAIHGRKAKTAIRDAWFNGNYRAVCLGQYDSTLQNLRNRDGGHGALRDVKLNSLRNLSAYRAAKGIL